MVQDDLSSVDDMYFLLVTVTTNILEKSQPP